MLQTMKIFPHGSDSRIFDLDFRISTAGAQDVRKFLISKS